MGILQTGPGCPTFDTRDPAGRELIVAADLSASHKAGRTEAVRVSKQAGRFVLADHATEMAADVATGPGERDGSRSDCWGSLDRQVRGECRSRGCERYNYGG